MTQMQGKSRRSYASAGAYVDGSSALKEAAQPVYVPSYAASPHHAPQTRTPPMRRQPPARDPHAQRAYFESASDKQQENARARVRPFSLGMILAVSLTAVMVTLGFMWLIQSSRYADLQYSIAQVQSQLTAQKRTNMELSQQLEVLKDGERIRTHAVNKLGMIAPGKGEERKISIILPRTQERIATTQEEKHYTLLDVLVDMLWF